MNITKQLLCASFWMVALACHSVAFAQTCPTNVSDLETGYWCEFANSDMAQVNPCPTDDCAWSGIQDGDVGLGQKHVMNGWSGGAMDTTRNRLLVWGGGHRGYAGNELYAFDVDTGTWEVVVAPSPVVQQGVCRYNDGRPTSRHTYNEVVYDAANDRFLSVGASGIYDPAGIGCNTVDAFSFVTNAWINLGERPGSQRPGGWSVYHPLTGDVYQRSAGFGLMKLDAQTQQWSQVVGNAPSIDIDMSAAIDPTRNLLVAVGAGRLLVYDLDAPDATPPTQPSYSGDDLVDQIRLGFEYDPVIDQFVAWIGAGADRGAIYTLDPDTWAWARINPAADSILPTDANLRGTYGRFRYVPSRNIYVVVNRVDENVYAYRLSDGEGNTPTPAPIVSFTASDAIINPNESTTLTWASSNATSCSASGSVEFNGTVNTSGSQTVSPDATTTYTLSCSSLGGIADESVSITVNQSAALPTVSLIANPMAVSQGDTTLLTWTSTDADDCEASDGWTGTKTTNNQAGENSAPLTADTLFSLTCSGIGGSASDEAFVMVQRMGVPKPVVNLSISTGSIKSGDSITLFWAPENASVCAASGDWFNVKNPAGGSETFNNITTNQSYSLTCRNSDMATAAETVNVTVAGLANPPTVDLNASPTSVASGESTLLSWSGTNITSCEASGDWSGVKNISGSETISNLTQSQSYILTCSGADGTAAESVNVIVSTAPNNDSDSDGLPDNWEMEHFGNLNQDANGDADNDGVNNLAEFNAGTNPAVANGSDEDSGGGALGWLWLCALFAAITRRRFFYPVGE